MVERSVVEAVRRYVDAVRKAGVHLTGAVVFGSHARGQATPDSDIDLIVISPEFDQRRDRRRTALLWRLRARTDSRIEPVAVGERQWREETGVPLISIAREEGEEISLN